MSDVQFPAAVQDGSGGFGIGATGRCRQQQRGDQSQCFAGQAHTIIPSVSSRQSEQRFRTAAEVMFRNNILIIQQTFRYFQRKAVMRKIFPIFFVYSSGAIRSMASAVSSAVPKAVRRRKPSPLGPKPSPGVPTTAASSSSRSKKAQESMPPGQRIQM